MVGWSLKGSGSNDAREAHLHAVRRLVEELQVRVVELNGDFTTLHPETFGKSYYEQVAQMQREQGFTCTMHLPFLWLDGASLAEPVRSATVQCMSQVLEASGIEYRHVRSAGNPHRQYRADPQRCLRLYRRHLADHPEVLQEVRGYLEYSATAVLCYEREHEACHRSVLLEELGAVGDPVEVVRVE